MPCFSIEKTSVHVIKLTKASILHDHQNGCVQEYHENAKFLDFTKKRRHDDCVQRTFINDIDQVKSDHRILMVSHFSSDSYYIRQDQSISDHDVMKS